MSGPAFAWCRDRLVPIAEAHVSVLDRGLLFAESVYETIPLVAGAPALVDEHAERMRRNAEAIGLADAPTVEYWQHVGRALATAEGTAEGLLYGQLTGGEAPRAHLPARMPTASFFAFVQTQLLPRADRVEAGISAITARDPRWDRCDLKTTMLLPAVLGKRAARAAGADEVLFLSATGELHEGGSSSAFIVEGGTIIGVPPSSHVLPGITEREIERAASTAGIELRREVVPESRLREAEEIFVAATSLLAMPVLRLDGRPVGTGRTGPIARQIAAGLRDRLGLQR